MQRVPVRIVVDASELAAHPLQIGLSMQVEVDTHDRDGERLPQLARSTPQYATDVFRSQDSLANERVRTIIAANESGAARTARSDARGPGAASTRLAVGNGAGKPAIVAHRNLQ